MDLLVFYVSASFGQRAGKFVIETRKGKEILFRTAKPSWLKVTRKERKEEEKEICRDRMWNEVLSQYLFSIFLVIFCLNLFLHFFNHVLTTGSFSPSLYLSLSSPPPLFYHPQHPLSLSLAHYRFPHVPSYLLSVFSQKNFRFVIYYLQEKLLSESVCYRGPLH